MSLNETTAVARTAPHNKRDTNMKNINSSRKGKIVFAALIASFLTSTANAETRTSAFEMMVISDSSHGKTVLSGSYDTAIHKLSTAKKADFAKYTNLCVAYTKSKNLDRAAEACQLAVSLAEEKALREVGKRGLSYLEHRNTQRNYAMALSNRGVLSAVKGDLDQAERDFNAAMELNTRNKRVKNNLARLSNMPLGASGQGVQDLT